MEPVLTMFGRPRTAQDYDEVTIVMRSVVYVFAEVNVAGEVIINGSELVSIVSMRSV